VESGKAAFHLPSPPDPPDCFVENAGLALSNDGRLVARAFGALQGGFMEIADTTTGATQRWPLGLGFDRLAYIGNDRFRLVREEFPSDPMRNLDTVVREYRLGGAPIEREAVRKSAPDELLFLNHELSRDGRYYLWIGPRHFPSKTRIELWDLQRRERLEQIPVPWPADGGQEPSAKLMPGRTSFWWRPQPDGRLRVTNFRTHETEFSSITPLLVVSTNLEWYADFAWATDTEPWNRLRLFAGDSQKPWIEVNAVNRGYPPTVAFSPKSRYCSWGSETGTLTIADIASLKKMIETAGLGN
jgi:hypothetical protein